VGQQSRTYQTWTVVGFLLLHHLLRLKPGDTHVLDLEQGPG
jgi:beta-fructofuranosidase